MSNYSIEGIEELEEEFEPLPTVLELYPSLFEPIDIELKPFVSKCQLPEYSSLSNDLEEALR